MSNQPHIHVSGQGLKFGISAVCKPMLKTNVEEEKWLRVVLQCTHLSSDLSVNGGKKYSMGSLMIVSRHYMRHEVYIPHY